MPVIKLNLSHKEAVRDLFFVDKNPQMEQLLYNRFCSVYLEDLTTDFHAYGYLEDNKIRALITFYESTEEPSWFYTMQRGHNDLSINILDVIIQHNEGQGRLKFYTLVRPYSNIHRKFHWSQYNYERYGYYDEFIVPANNKCFYINTWELLFNHGSFPQDMILRCNYLKQEYRAELPIGGNL